VNVVQLVVTPNLCAQALDLALYGLSAALGQLPFNSILDLMAEALVLIVSGQS
jgi:hypothetical protein